MTHPRTPLAALGRTPRKPFLAVAALLTLTAVGIAHAQTPVDENPAPPPSATAPVDNAPPATPSPPDNASPPPAAPETPMPPVNSSPSVPLANSSSASIVTTSPTAPATSTVELNMAARDSRTLNPLLIPTDGDLHDALDYGRGFGQTKQDFIDLLGDARKSFDYRNGGMFGEKRRPESTAVWVTPDLEARWRGFLESRTFADQARRDSDFATMQQEVTSPQRSLVFIVEVGGLISGHTDPTQQQLDAAYTSLAGTRFVLSDDHGNNYDPQNVATATKLVRRQDFYDALSIGPDHLGQAAFDDTTANSRALVLRRKPYSDYAATYIVSFNAFNADGSARINRDVHGITLRIITPDDPKYAVFDISKMP